MVHVWSDYRGRTETECALEGAEAAAFVRGEYRTVAKCSRASDEWKSRRITKGKMTVNCFERMLFRSAALGLMMGASWFDGYAQTPTAAPSSVERAHVGDAPEDAGPLATDVSAEITPKAIDAAMKKV